MEHLIFYATVAGIILLPPAFLWFRRKEIVQKYFDLFFETIIFPVLICFGFWIMLSFITDFLSLSGFELINLAVSLVFTVHLCNAKKSEHKLIS